MLSADGVVLIVLTVVVILVAVFVVVSLVVRRTGGYAPGWQLRCKKCNAIWDAGEVGIVRIGAASRGKVTYGRCKNCRKWAWMAIERKPEIEATR